MSFPLAIDSTMRGVFVSCPRKFEYEFLRNKAKSEKSVHLIAGGAFARGCEMVRRGYFEYGLTDKQALGLGAEALIKHYGDFEPPEKSPKTCDNMLAALAEYFTVYGMHTDAIQPLVSAGKPCIEFTFAIPIPGTAHPITGEPILYTGRFDMLGVFNGGVYAVDEKTTGQLGASWLNQWKLRSQLTGYCWAAREYGYPVVGAIIRGISILKSSFGHAESIQYRPDYMIERWLTQLQHDIERMIRCWRQGYWDLTIDGACTNFGGCQFLDVCSARDPDVWLEADFIERNWDPLALQEV